MPSDIGRELFRNVVKALITLIELEEQNYVATVSDFLNEAGLNKTIFFQHLKRNLERSGWVEFRVNPDRTITVHLTEKGRKLAKCLKQCEDILKEAGVI